MRLASVERRTSIYVGIIREQTGIALSTLTACSSAQRGRGSCHDTQAGASSSSCQVFHGGFQLLFAEFPPPSLAVARQQLAHATTTRLATTILADRPRTLSRGRFFDSDDRVNRIGSEILDRSVDV